MRIRPLPILVVLALAILWLPGFGQPPVERFDNTGARALEPVPFTLSVGRYYLLFTPDNRPIPTERSPVLALRSYPNGWVDVKTLDDQVVTINMMHMMQVVRIDDIEKYRKTSSK
jgi:hypothetical protein